MRLQFCAAGALVVVLASVWPAVADADEVLFNNGDRLSGEILSAADGKLKIKTAVAGEVTVEMKDVRTFTTDAPITLQLDDGSVIRDEVAGAAADADAADDDDDDDSTQGVVQTVGAGAVAAQTIDLARVEKINPPPQEWTGSLVGAALIARGNTQSESYSLIFNAVRRGEQDRLTFDAGYFFGRDTDPDTGIESTTTDNWFLAGKYDYFFSERWYGYANARVERDRIAALDLRFTPGIGAGYQWIDRADFSFSTEAGISWVYEDYETGASDDHFAARLAYRLVKQINDKVRLFHNLEFLPSLEELDDFNLIGDAGVRVTMVEDLFGEAKLEWRYDSTPAPGAEKNDLRWVLGVGWEF